MYGIPASGTAAAPPVSSPPAYMYSHQYQRKCFHFQNLAVYHEGHWLTKKIDFILVEQPCLAH